MSQSSQPILDQPNTIPRWLFLIDSCGAFITAILTGLVLTRLEAYFGMPSVILIPLSIIACVFALYSMACYLFVGQNWRRFLKIIAVANLVYVVITLGLLFWLYAYLTPLGLLYFISECFVIVALSYLELKAASNPIVRK